MKEFKDSFLTPVDITYKGISKISKTLDYGYAHTIHKSQGGTYNYSFVLENTINAFTDARLKAQLKYVAVTRAESVSYILTQHAITNNNSNTNQQIESNIDEASMTKSESLWNNHKENLLSKYPTLTLEEFQAKVEHSLTRN